MRTHLAQNQFLPNSATPPPAVADTAAVDQPAPQVAAAEPFDEPSMTMEVPSEAPAGSAPNSTMTPALLGWDIDGTEDIHQIFHHARLLCGQPGAEEHRFVPDFAALYQATIDDDPLPAFLQRDAG